MWLADRYHAREYGRTITSDNIFALPKGLVPSVAKDIIDGKRDCHQSNFIERIGKSFNYKSIRDVDKSCFSETDIQVLELVYNTFGGYSPRVLSDISHKFPEWKRFESNLQAENQKNAYAINEEDLFIEVTDSRCNNLFLNDNELIEITKEMFFKTLS